MTATQKKRLPKKWGNQNTENNQTKTMIILNFALGGVAIHHLLLTNGFAFNGHLSPLGSTISFLFHVFFDTFNLFTYLPV